MLVRLDNLTKRRYLAEIIEVGTNNLKGYYKVRLLDFEDDNNNIIMAKERINRYIGENGQGSYYPLLPGDKVIIEFLGSLNTSAVIVDVFTPRSYSYKINTLDSSLLNNSEKYIVLKTHKNSRIEFDEKTNYTLYSYRSNLGYMKITDNNLTIYHNTDIKQTSNNNFSISSSNVKVTSNKTEIIGSKILLHSGSFNSSAQTINLNQLQIKEFSSKLSSCISKSEHINKLVKIQALDDKKLAKNLLQEYIQKELGNEIIQYKHDEKNPNHYMIIIPSIKSLKKSLVENQKQKNEVIKNIANQVKQNYEDNKEQLREKIISTAERIKNNIDFLKRHIQNNKDKLDKVKEIVEKIQYEISRC